MTHSDEDEARSNNDRCVGGCGRVLPKQDANPNGLRLDACSAWWDDAATGRTDPEVQRVMDQAGGGHEGRRALRRAHTRALRNRERREAAQGTAPLERFTERETTAPGAHSGQMLSTPEK